MFMSNMWFGSKRDSSRVPLLTTGNLGGTLESDRSFTLENETLSNGSRQRSRGGAPRRFGLPPRAAGSQHRRASRLLPTSRTDDNCGP